MNFIGIPRYLNSAASLVRLISSAVWLFPGFILIVYQVHINASFTSVTALIHPKVFGNDIWRPCILSLKSEELDMTEFVIPPLTMILNLSVDVLRLSS